MSQPQTLKNSTPEKFLNRILEEAVRSRASDVHIEPLAESLRVRFRVDGSLREHYRQPLSETEQLVTRIKAISDLDIASHLPQDGHFEFTVDLTEPTEASSGISKPSPLAHALTSLFGEAEEQNSTKDLISQSTTETKLRRQPAGMCVLNVRVSVFPTVYGEAVVLRLLNRADMLIPLAKLGMAEEDLASVRDIIFHNYGMILSTGPSGAGKSTTLYAILQELKNKEKNIVTLEDPVEFYFGDIRQTQIRPEQGLTYAVGMRSILRQDPDVLMVGEIRDHETAEYAMRVSLVGRIVGSTIHSNSTIGTIARLIDMDVERSLIAYALSGIVSQRLARRMCTVCATEYTPDPVLIKRLGLTGAAFQFRKGVGCDACGGMGYSGRTGIYAVLRMDDALRSLIVDHSSMRTLQEYVQQSGSPSLSQRAAEKVLAGETTVEEAVLVI
ncbi:MAG: hypothetical protein A2719_05430 [Candidatus Ryanbacteria bacterium RIFCSPHIGHO2_01_FULL_45_22]|uniref:Bacterial type II secretion system protein E domain-containing protein n=2 Tax=Candidatus Ryaniibacteriota TaxID=1817914 RepID=A0A1G2G017_9BACT|nr:MAG: hypothetical protein A2719_05430 [Candidatus Ryanbacteria bacterium RIFCSPHIGHO2_01_FULL_45_22]OGZ45395.1 MAG: hypothetical protein A3J54_00905 [Candidatus Ryanbacteria bacterium RIFCSPHIGHO2_02_FULL_45_13b]